MELKEVMLKRRSVRKFKKDKITNEIIEEILHMAMSGPSACNRRPWEFYVIKNEETLDKLRGATRYTNMVAPLAIVVAGNLNNALKRSISEYWVQDCSAAVENILLAATNVNLGSCWCGLYPQTKGVETVREALNLEQEIVPLGLIYLGYADTVVEPRDQYEVEKVHYFE